jgi:two-component system, LytTR family, response regulator
MINAILIDDEAHCLDTLSMLIDDYCPDVKIIERCVSAAQGIAAIKEHQPELVFLDIEMPFMNGFELLEELKEISFSVIFTTGYDQYAIKAIRFSALDYLLKPINPKELVTAIHKVKTQHHAPSTEQLYMLIEQIRHKDKVLSKIALPTIEGFALIPADQIIRCEANDNYTQFFLKNNNKITACRTLKDVEEQLQPFTLFMRVHHSYLVNLDEVVKYVRGDGGYLVMSDGSAVSVSRSRKDALLKFF